MGALLPLRLREMVTSDVVSIFFFLFG
uniref:Uncharacterized protein n=1 Tax=Anguilla anguilla TaxID=7936 RepID=A0A0E9TP14_ANGAN